MAIFLAIGGSTFLVVAQLLHQISQGLECKTFAMPTVKSERFHNALVALPLLAAIAASCMAVMIFGYLVFSIRVIHHTVRFLHTHAAEQAEAAARARAQAAEAQLAALQAHMNPHFLFNALNTVAALVRTNGRDAEETVEHLAEVLRRTLDRSRSNGGTVAEEVDYLKAYLGIEQQRYGARLKVMWTVDADALACALPPLTLQPLVENALRHGIGSRLEGGEIAITVARNNGDLHLSVADDGVGFPARYREGTGLSILRQRLQTLYEARSTLTITSTPGDTRVTVQLPAGE
jgi:LytS/YehU family sensor histidine kinase